MNFEVLSVPSADPGYGSYNIGPAQGSQSYEGRSFTDVHDDGTAYCGEAQAMPAVVSIQYTGTAANIKSPDDLSLRKRNDRAGQTFQNKKGIPLGAVIMQEKTPFVVPSYIDFTRKMQSGGTDTIFIPIAVTGATMVESKYIVGGNQAIKAGSLLHVQKKGGAGPIEEYPIGIAMLDEEAVTSGTNRLLMIFVSG